MKKPITDEQILYLAQELAPEHGCTVKLVRDADGLVLERPGRHESVVLYLSRIRSVAASASSPDALRSWLRSQFRHYVAEQPAFHALTWEVARPQLLARVDHIDSCFPGLPSHLAKPGKEIATEVLHRPLRGMEESHSSLREIVVVDFPDHIMLLPRHMVEETWGVSPDEVFQAARANAAAQISTKEVIAVFPEADAPKAPEPLKPLLGCFVPDYGSTRMLFVRELLSTWPEHGVLASAPARGIVLIMPLGADPTPSSVIAMLEISRSTWGRVKAANEHPVSPEVIYSPDGDRWEAAPQISVGGSHVITPGPRLLEALSLPEDATIALLELPGTLLGGE